MPLARARRRHAGRPRGAAPRARRVAAGRRPHPRAARGSRGRLIELHALPGLPEVRPGDDLARADRGRRRRARRAGDVLASRTRSSRKAEGRIVRLADVTPGARALALAAEHGKDPRHVEVVLSETARARPRRRRPADLPHPPRLRVRERGRRRVQRRRAGLADPAPARPRRLGPRAARRAPGPPRGGRSPTPSAAPGARASARSRSASPACTRCEDWRGRPDSGGRELHATVIAIADEAAAAADLVRAQGLARARRARCAAWSATSPPRTARASRALIRALEHDLFQLIGRVVQSAGRTPPWWTLIAADERASKQHCSP